MSLRRIECHVGQFASTVHDRTFVPLARIGPARGGTLFAMSKEATFRTANSPQVITDLRGEPTIVKTADDSPDDLSGLL